MKLPLDGIDLPVALAYQIGGVIASILGITATTIYGSYAKLATISPEELAIQPLHVVLIFFIVALATFIALILRAVWGRGLSTVNRFSEAIENLSTLLTEMKSSIEGLKKVQENHLEKFQDLSLHTLRDVTSAKASK